MSDPSKFPVRRLRDAGATQAEIDELNLAFVRSDEVYQREFVDSFRGRSKVEVLAWLQDARRDGYVTKDATEKADPKDEVKDDDVERGGLFKRNEEPKATVLTGNEESEGDD